MTFRAILSLVLLLGSLSCDSQVLQPAKVTTSASKLEVKAGDEVELIFSATVDAGWYIYSIYSSEFDADCGPIAFSVALEKNSTFEMVGELQAIKDKKKHDEIFGCDVMIFEGKGEFRQKIRILAANPLIKGAYDGQACTEKEGKCVLFDGEVLVTGFKVVGGTTATPVITLPTDTATVTNQQKSTVTAQTFAGPVLDKAILEGEPTLNEESFIGYLLFAFVLGLTSLLTPCVFPMIPMTVTFFLRDNRNQKGRDQESGDLRLVHHSYLYSRRKRVCSCAGSRWIECPCYTLGA